MPLKPLAFYKDLAEAKGRREHGLFLVEGPRAIRQTLICAPSAVQELLLQEGAEPPAGAACPVRVLDGRQMRSIAQAQTPAGCIAVVAMPAGANDASLPAGVEGPVLLLEHVQDPGNTGTLIRTAAALGFEGVLLSEKSADPFGPKAVQAAAGSTLALWTRRTAGYLASVKELKKAGLRVAAAATRGGTPLAPSGSRGIVLALGNEGSGLSPELEALADVSFTVPIDTTRAESLNVAACGAIAMYALTSGGGGGAVR